MTNNPYYQAAEALRAMGRYVEPLGDDLSLWLVDGEEMSGAGLMKLAALLGLIQGSATIQ
ncbi:hypothetical protein FV226_24705 [Methylobacterium sp. WL12]|uniref:hypothetical protein n=1 Tax=Methylobacterium sp. WL12 TaxID=2603890 RepID=UPI0011C9DF4E|nr:hypothetical protein [Methylobacterium sp. WL12]TXM65640.1 hypothetical protein FV226_24705 [Methylobacterium sp. WL12]TXN13953.1 hypothetical protein FV219_04140 [Methylobacterium sp. WL122]